MDNPPYVPHRVLARITPELALVDPDLARRTRRWLPTSGARRTLPLPVLGRTGGTIPVATTGAVTPRLKPASDDRPRGK
jgi:hypothetical protein